MTIVPHIYDNDNLIFQLDEDTWFGDYLVYKGYVNATQICQAGGKLLGHYLSPKQQRIQLYLNTLASDIGIPITGFEDEPGLIVVIQGGVPESQGTWVHPYVAMNIARWVSPEFEVWGDKTLWYVLSDDYEPDDDRMVELKDVGLRHWKRLRRETKALFRPMTDTFKDYWEQNNYNPDSWDYARVVDKINLLLFDMTAKEIRELEGLHSDSQLTRDNFGEEALDRISYLQKLIVGVMRYDNLEPEFAIDKAFQMMDVTPIHYKS